jgi:hypothetical protein
MLLGATKEMIVGLVRDKQTYMKAWMLAFIMYEVQLNDIEVM